MRPTQWTLFLVAVGGMFMTFVWRMQQVFPMLRPMRITIIVSLIALFLFLAKPDLEKALRVMRHPTYRYAALLFLWMVISIPTGVFAGKSFYFTFDDHLKTLLFFTVIAAGVRGLADIERLIVVQVLGGSIYSVLTLINGMGKGGKLGGVAYYDANDLALVMVTGAPLALYLLLRGRGAARLIGLMGFLLFLQTAVRTGSRGGFLGLLAMGLYLLFQLKAVKSSVRAGAAAAALIAFAFVASAEYKHALSTLLNPTEDYNYDSPTGRLEIWKRGLGYMIQRPINGVGAGAFAIAEGSLSEIGQRLAAQGQGFKWSVAHNAYVEIGAETGFPGIYFFLAMLGSAFIAARRVGLYAPHRSKEAVLGQVMGASLVGYAVSAIFLSAGYSAMLYSFLGLLVGFTHMSQKYAVPAARALPQRRPIGRGARSLPTPPAVLPQAK